MMNKVLIIDDIKEPSHIYSKDKICRSYKEGISALMLEDWDLLLLDHDLASYENGEEKTGYHVLCFLEEHKEFLPKDIKLITRNPVGRERMQKVIDKLYKR